MKMDFNFTALSQTASAVKSTARLALYACIALATLPAQGESTRADLEYGSVLFEYYQDNYFKGLVEQSYVRAKNNQRAQSHRGQLRQGSMALAYGMADTAQDVFDRVLDEETDNEVRNRAWYYLAKLYHERSKPAEAFAALQNIRGDLPSDLHLDYRYLATLVNKDAEHLNSVQKAVDKIPADSPQYPYLLFNLGVSHLQAGNQSAAIDNLTRVVNDADDSEEQRVLADRARHGLARVAIQNQRLPQAWSYLQNISTEGLYSNRALLAYAWTAIRQGLFQTAIPALRLLNERSIALAEVQESMVLLGQVYEQQGDPTRALKSQLAAESALETGLQRLIDARRTVQQSGLPEKLTTNLDAAADVNDWEAVESSESYSKLAPFLLDLMASNPFQQVHTELSYLYALRDNLAHWARQTDQHEIILESADGKIFDDKMKRVIKDSTRLNERLANQRKELGLLTLSLDVEEQARFEAVLEHSSRELAQLDDRVELLGKQSEPYRQPPSYQAMVGEHHRRIEERRQETEAYIQRLEPAMRKLVNAELKKHEKRIRYYLAQARLAKARLYDMTLTGPENPDAGSAKQGGQSP